MPLLCTLIWSLILLPLGFGCESQKSKEDIAMDYSNIIQKRIENILNDRELSETTCKPANRNECKNVSPQILNRVVCRHSKTDFYHMTSQVKTLTELIHGSFGCACEEKDGKKKPQRSLQRKLCTLKHWLERIKDLYSQFNSS